MANQMERLSEMHVEKLLRAKNAKVLRELLLLALAAAITIAASFSLGRLPALGYPFMIVGLTSAGWFARGVYQAQQIDIRFYPNGSGPS